MKTALNKVRENSYDVALLDLSLPDSSGLETVTAFLEAAPGLPVVVLTGSENEELGLDVLKYGAQDYLIKGQVDGKALAKTMLFAMKRKRVAATTNSPAPVERKDSKRVHQVESNSVEPKPERFSSEQDPTIGKIMVGSSPAISKIYQVIQKAGASDSTVLITGETGTGKELVAQALHEAGPRRNCQLVAVNCGSIPETLLESVLFGHVKGAFTGADRDKRGLFEVAKDGTLFLDEIGELPISLQPKILRALEKREVLPVGSTVPVRFGARVVAATNRDLTAMMKDNLFRTDLYYRLNVIEITIPPLRERFEDIPVIAEFLLKRLCYKMQRSVPQVEPGVLQTFETCAWPGNIREMSNVLERLLILSEGNCIRQADLESVRIAAQVNVTDNLKMSRQAFEREQIRRVLKKWGGNKEHAARALGIDLSSLYRKLSD